MEVHGTCGELRLEVERLRARAAGHVGGARARCTAHRGAEGARGRRPHASGGGRWPPPRRVSRGLRYVARHRSRRVAGAPRAGSHLPSGPLETATHPPHARGVVVRSPREESLQVPRIARHVRTTSSTRSPPGEDSARRGRVAARGGQDAPAATRGLARPTSGECRGQGRTRARGAAATNSNTDRIEAFMRPSHPYQASRSRRVGKPFPWRASHFATAHDEARRCQGADVRPDSPR